MPKSHIDIALRKVRHSSKKNMAETIKSEIIDQKIALNDLDSNGDSVLKALLLTVFDYNNFGFFSFLENHKPNSNSNKPSSNKSALESIKNKKVVSVINTVGLDNIVNEVLNDNTKNNPIFVIVNSRSSSDMLNLLLSSIDFNDKKVLASPGIKMITESLGWTSQDNTHRPSDFIFALSVFLKSTNNKKLINQGNLLETEYVLKNLFLPKDINKTNYNDYSEHVDVNINSYHAALINNTIEYLNNNTISTADLKNIISSNNLSANISDVYLSYINRSNNINKVDDSLPNAMIHLVDLLTQKGVFNYNDLNVVVLNTFHPTSFKYCSTNYVYHSVTEDIIKTLNKCLQAALDNVYIAMDNVYINEKVLADDVVKTSKEIYVNSLDKLLSVKKDFYLNLLTKIDTPFNLYSNKQFFDLNQAITDNLNEISATKERLSQINDIKAETKSLIFKNMAIDIEELINSIPEKFTNIHSVIKESVQFGYEDLSNLQSGHNETMNLAKKDIDKYMEIIAAAIKLHEITGDTIYNNVDEHIALFKSQTNNTINKNDQAAEIEPQVDENKEYLIVINNLLNELDSKIKSLPIENKVMERDNFINNTNDIKKNIEDGNYSIALSEAEAEHDSHNVFNFIRANVISNIVFGKSADFDSSKQPLMAALLFINSYIGKLKSNIINDDVQRVLEMVDKNPVINKDQDIKKLLNSISENLDKTNIKNKTRLINQ